MALVSWVLISTPPLFSKISRNRRSARGGWIYIEIDGAGRRAIVKCTIVNYGVILRSSSQRREIRLNGIVVLDHVDVAPLVVYLQLLIDLFNIFPGSSSSSTCVRHLLLLRSNC